MAQIKRPETLTPEPQHDKGEREAEQNARDNNDWRQKRGPVGRSSNNR